MMCQLILLSVLKLILLEYATEVISFFYAFLPLDWLQRVCRLNYLELAQKLKQSHTVWSDSA